METKPHTLGEVRPVEPGRRENYNMGEVIALRKEAGLPDDVSAIKVSEVIERVGGDFDLALSALTMVPRPGWVIETLGLHPARKS
jgi:hypothetical protein